MSNSPKKVALLLHDLEEGGMQAVCLRLLEAFLQYPEIELELVLSNQVGGFWDRLPEGVKVVNLNLPFVLRFKYIVELTTALSKYLTHSKPDYLLSNLPFINLAAVLANFFSRHKSSTILIEHTIPIDRQIKQEGNSKLSQEFIFIVITMMRLLYPFANYIVVPSNGMAKELGRILRFKSDQTNLKVIYNPVVDDQLNQKAQAVLDHPWFQTEGPPVFLSVGRLTPQKDHETLLRAFACLREEIPARLIILGDGEMRATLENLIKSLGLEADVLLLGFVDNPYAYMSRAAAFILSSVWETFGVVLVEALACGCPVISTNCDFGPAEILDGGRYGALAPVKDHKSLAKAMKTVLENPRVWDEATLKNRARKFSLDRAAEQYLAVMGI